MEAMAFPVPVGEAGLLVKLPSKLNRPNALCEGGESVSLIMCRITSTPNLKLCVPRCQVTLPTFSIPCSRRICGSPRELPNPPNPDGLMMGAEFPKPPPGTGCSPGLGTRPGISAQIGEVNTGGIRKLVYRLNPNLYSPTILGVNTLLYPNTPCCPRSAW